MFFTLHCFLISINYCLFYYIIIKGFFYKIKALTLYILLKKFDFVTIIQNYSLNIFNIQFVKTLAIFKNYEIY